MKLKKFDQQQLRTEVPRHCWLSDQAVRMAKELGLSPQEPDQEQRVLWHQGSFGSDSAAGSRSVERLLTVVAYCR